MLTRLCIANLAILENVDVTFHEGFTVLTGGTGAGKSLVIDSLSLLLGQRASSELIRTGAEKATIQGIFTVDSSRLSSLLTKLDIPLENGELCIERTITHSKNTIKANGVTLTLNALNQIARQLADIHNQFEFAKLLNPDNYLDLVDGFSFDKVAGYKSDYAQKLESYQKAKQRYEELLAQKAKVEASKDFYQFQLKELDEANLQENEEADIASEIALLGNYDRVYSLMEEADSIAHEDFIDRLYELSKTLGKLAAYQSQYKVTQEQVEEHYYSLQDTLSQLKKDFRNLDYDPERLNQLQQRSSDIAALKRKYRKSVPELLAYQRELRSLVGEGSDLEGDIQAKKEETEQFHHQAYESGMALRALRKTLARTMENEVRHNLEDLLLSCDFRIDFGADPSEEGVTFLSSGIDSIDFLIETNVGEGLKSLSKVVSGGEASRIMLAFKAVFVKANRVSTVIFDEIDTGLSGEAAQAVASKIKDISLSTQVIAITHMPQVAALSDHHVLVEKSVMLGRTSTSIKELSLEEKIHEVAYLISGGKVTKKQLEYAKEIILGGR